MNIVIVDKKDALIKTQNNTLIVNTQKIPLHLIDTLLIIGTTTLKTSDINKITAEKINILLLSYNHTASAIITSTSGKSAEVKTAQYNAATTTYLPIAKEILKRKIITHIEHLNTHDIVIDQTPLLHNITQAENRDILLGIEGSFSRVYFGHYFTLFPKTLHKSKRTKRPPLDPLNALLSLYYTLFYNIIAIRLIAYGFEPSIGFLHRPFRSHHALASDILELFRADINAFVHDIFAQKLVTLGDFTKKGGVYLRYEGRKKLWTPFREFTATIEPKIDASIADIRGML